MKIFSIAIDGPAGSGKSTIAKRLAERLDCIYIDTGAMYRAVGLYCIQQHIDYYIEELVTQAIPCIQLELHIENNRQYIALNGVNVSEAIRASEVAQAASQVATYKAVREALVTQQRQMKDEKSVVMDGRDIGTVVMPDATLKIFLTASVSERANRRYKDHQEKGEQIALQQLIKEIEQRDYQDTHRSISPLKQAEDAVVIDTTSLTIEEIIETILSYL